jgi:hypothetical protein
MVACIEFFEMSEICRPKFIVRHSTTASKKVAHQTSVSFEKFNVVQALLSFWF